MTHFNHVWINKELDYIDKYFDKIDFERQAIVVLGDTGVGKSTVASILADYNLKTVEYGSQTVLEAVSPTHFFQISHGKASKTYVCNRQTRGNLDIIECPPFDDNRNSDAELVNAYYTSNILARYKKIKMVLVIDDSYVSECRLTKMSLILTSLFKLVGNLSKLHENLVLCINKAKPDHSVADYLALLQSFIKQKETLSLLTLSQQALIRTLTADNKLIVLPAINQVTVAQPFSEILRETFWNTLDRIKYSSFEKMQYSISDSCLVLLANKKWLLSKVESFSFISEKIKKEFKDKLKKYIKCTQKMEALSLILGSIRRTQNKSHPQEQILEDLLQILGINQEELNVKTEIEEGKIIKLFYGGQNPMLSTIRTIFIDQVQIQSYEFNIQAAKEAFNSYNEDQATTCKRKDNFQKRLDQSEAKLNKKGKNKGKELLRQAAPAGNTNIQAVLSDIFHQTHLNKIELKRLLEGADVLKPISDNLEQSQKRMLEVPKESKLHADISQELRESVDTVKAITKIIESNVHLIIEDAVQKFSVKRKDKKQAKRLQLLTRRKPVNLRHRFAKDNDPSSIGLEDYLNLKRRFSLDARWLSTPAERCFPHKPKKWTGFDCTHMPNGEQFCQCIKDRKAALVQKRDTKFSFVFAK